MVIELLFAALLALMPRVPQPMRGCIARHRGLIVHEVAQGAETHGVPPAVLLVVGMLESHYGCAPHSGGWRGGRNVCSSREAAAGMSIKEMVWLPNCGLREAR